MRSHPALIGFGLLSLCSRAQAVPPLPACLESRTEIPEAELLARLAFAEGISTNYASRPECAELGERIFELIAHGVMSRVRLAESNPKAARSFGHGIRGVIFHRGQFNPAISKRSRFARYFRCPREAPDAETRWKWASQAAERAKQEPSVLPSGVTHFYYPLSEQATRAPPAWADPKHRTPPPEVRGKAVPHACIGFYEVPAALW